MVAEEIKTVYIKSDWLRNFINEHGGKLFVVQVITIVG